MTRRRHRVAENALALYVLQGAHYLIAFVTVPYLTRVLGPVGFGRVAFLQSLGIYVGLILDYGFTFSATREISRSRDDQGSRSSLVTDVVSAKFVLALGTAVVGTGLLATVDILGSDLRLLFCGIAWCVLQGFTLHFYFQGTEQMRLLAILDFTPKALAVGGIFVLVEGASDAWLVFALQGAGAVVALGAAVFLVVRETPLLRPSWDRAKAGLRSGWDLFKFKAGLTLYAMGNTFVMGLIAPARLVGFFGAGEKLVRVAMSVPTPVVQSLFPHMSRLVVEDEAAAARAVRRLMRAMLGWGLAVAAGVTVAAPWMVSTLFGPGYEPVVAVLRILIWAVPLNAVNTALGMQWMIPLGRERECTRIVLAGGVALVVLAVLLVPPFDQTGMAVAVVASHALVLGGFVVTLTRQGILPTKKLREGIEDGGQTDAPRLSKDPA